MPAVPVAEASARCARRLLARGGRALVRSRQRHHGRAPACATGHGVRLLLRRADRQRGLAPADQDGQPFDVALYTRGRYLMPDPSPGSKLADDLASGAVIGGKAAYLQTVAAGLMLDTRDDEIMPRRGILYTAGMAGTVGTAESVQFGEGSIALSHYASFGRALIFANRILASMKFGNVPFYELQQGDVFTPKYLVGGNKGVRGVRLGRYAGLAKALVNTELRILPLPRFKVFGCEHPRGSDRVLRCRTRVERLRVPAEHGRHDARPQVGRRRRHVLRVEPGPRVPHRCGVLTRSGRGTRRGLLRQRVPLLKCVEPPMNSLFRFALTVRRRRSPPCSACERRTRTRARRRREGAAPNVLRAGRRLAAPSRVGARPGEPRNRGGAGIDRSSLVYGACREPRDERNRLHATRRLHRYRTHARVRRSDGAAHRPPEAAPGARRGRASTRPAGRRDRRADHGACARSESSHSMSTSVRLARAHRIPDLRLGRDQPALRARGDPRRRGVLLVIHSRGSLFEPARDLSRRRGVRERASLRPGDGCPPSPMRSGLSKPLPAAETRRILEALAGRWWRAGTPWPAPSIPIAHSFDIGPHVMPALAPADVAPLPAAPAVLDVPEVDDAGAPLADLYRLEIVPDLRVLRGLAGSPFPVVTGDNLALLVDTVRSDIEAGNDAPRDDPPHLRSRRARRGRSLTTSSASGSSTLKASGRHRVAAVRASQGRVRRLARRRSRRHPRR